MTTLKQDFEYFLSEHAALVKKYNGRTIVIKNKNVIGDYADEVSAIKEAQKEGHQIGSFLVQKVSESPDSYTQTFHSRVVAA